jgi:hypothetical protein
MVKMKVMLSGSILRLQKEVPWVVGMTALETSSSLLES